MPDGQIVFEQNAPRTEAPKRQRVIKVTTARTLEDIMRVTAIRAAVYMAEQDCPYDEEFDGNNFCATHLIGWVDGEPVACLRLRYFGGFAKMERVAVKASYRKTKIAFRLIRAGIDHAARKGFEKIVGHAAHFSQRLIHRVHGDDDAGGLTAAGHALAHQRHGDGAPVGQFPPRHHQQVAALALLAENQGRVGDQSRKVSQCARCHHVLMLLDNADDRPARDG